MYGRSKEECTNVCRDAARSGTCVNCDSISTSLLVS